jgi:hypothetical protein
VSSEAMKAQVREMIQDMDIRREEGLVEGVAVN